MQETVTDNNERKSLFSSFLEVMEASEQKAQSERQIQEEKYLRRTQRIYDFHERQRCTVAELRRCLDYVSQHAHVLESVLRGSGGAGEVPLSAALVSQAAALQRCMSQCVANAERIRRLLTATHQPQMDTMLAKMEAELSSWTEFLQRGLDATYNTELVLENLHNMLEAQRRCVRDISASSVISSLCVPDYAASESAEALSTPAPPTEVETNSAANSSAHSSFGRRSPLAICSTPIAQE